MKMIDLLSKHNLDINSLGSEIPSEQKSKEFLEYIEKSFDYLSVEFTKIENSLVGIEIEKGHFKLKIQNFANKIVVQINTIFLLIGINLGKEEDSYKIDFQTLHIVIRSIIESILMFSYIYKIPKNEEEQYFRNLVWEFTDFQNIVNNKSKDTNSKLNEIDLIMNERYDNLKSELESNRHFINLKRDYKYKILKKSDCRFDTTWSKIAIDSGLEETRFKKVYSELCSYSHSGNNSIISEHLPLNLKFALIADNLFYLLIIFSMFIIEYCMIIDKANEELAKNDELVVYLSILIQKASDKNFIIKDKFIK